MANFEVSTRVDYRDVSNLIVDCSAGDMEVDTAGRILTWFNRARQDPSTGGRLQNLIQTDDASKPLRDQSNGSAVFEGSQYLTAALVGTMGGLTRDWTIAVDIDPGVSTAGFQGVLATENGTFRMWRRNVTNYGYETTAGIVLGSSDMVAGLNVYASNGATTDWRQDNVLDITAGVADPWGFTADADDALIVGGTQVGGNLLTGSIHSIRWWSRVLSPSELDLVHQTVGRVDSSVGDPPFQRTTLEVATWSDDTFDQSLGQVNRLNPQIGITHKYIKATIPANEASALVQFACEVEAEVKPDASLGGNLFTLTAVELPGTSQPAIIQAAGWSAVFDVLLSLEGHYTFKFERPSGGSVYVHLDVVRTTPI